MNDDGVFARFLAVLNGGFRTDIKLAATCSVSITNSTSAIDDAARWEIGARQMLHQLLNGDVRFIEHRNGCVDDFRDIVWRYIRSHADGDTGAAIYQQIRNSGRENRRLFLRTIVVGDKVDGLLIDVRKQILSDLVHAHFGISHSCRWITIYGTKVALSVDQHVAHAEWLRHTNHRIVNGGIAVRVVFTHNLTHHTRRFSVRAVVVVVLFVHGKQDATMHRF